MAVHFDDLSRSLSAAVEAFSDLLEAQVLLSAQAVHLGGSLVGGFGPAFVAVYHLSCTARRAARVGKMSSPQRWMSPLAHSPLMASSVVSWSPKSRISSASDQGRWSSASVSRSRMQVPGSL